MFKPGEQVAAIKWGDLFLQVLFVLGLVLLIVVFYFNRIGNLRAEDRNVLSFGFENLQTAYQFEQEEKKIETRIKVLKVDYAEDLTIFRKQLDIIESATDYSLLEKREKVKVLKNLYSDEYFDRKESLIDQENLKLVNLQKLKCLKFCTNDDLLLVQ